MKLLILIVAVYLGYRILKSWMLRGTARRYHGPGPGDRQIDDVMVQDPVCEVYIPKKEGIRLHVDGRDHYFCSNACKDKFLENR